MLRLLLLLLVITVVQAQQTGGTPTVRLGDGKDTPEDLRATQAMEYLEAKLEDQRALEPAARWAAQGRLLPDLERTINHCVGTRLANKAQYMLGSWHLDHGSYAACERAIEAIIGSGSPSYHTLAIHLRGRLRLKQGQVAEARTDAEYIADLLPTLSPLLDQVRFHERNGQPAPRLTARNLDGGPDDPLSARTEPWLLVCFARLTDPEQRFLTATLLATLTDPAFAGKVRPVVVSFDDDALGAVTRLRELPGGSSMDLLWLGPDDPTARQQWVREWHLPTLPTSALLGPDRSIASAEPAPDRLRALVGLKPLGEGSGKEPRRGGMFGWKGRK